MLRKVGVGLVLLLVVFVLAGFWARSVLSQDIVRAQLAAQLSRAIGQPVTIGRISASIYPRITVNLGDVRIGEPHKITARTLHVGADFRALLSRRIEHARMRLDGARVELPLPAFSLGAPADTDATARGGVGVEIVSIDEVVLSDVEVVSRGRTLRGDVEIVPEGSGATIRRMSLTADGATVHVAGRIADLAGPAGELQVKAGQLDLDRLLAFFQDFSSGVGLDRSAGAPPPSTGPTPPVTGGSGPNLLIGIDAPAASMGSIRVERLAARLRLTSEQIVLDPLRFGLFSGGYDGILGVATGGDVPAFRWNAALSGIDLGALTGFAGRPDTISGTLSGRIDLTGQGSDAATAMRSARGTARVEIANGVIRNLGLVRSIVVATSGRAGETPEAGSSRDERFTRLSATLAIAGALARSNDLLFESENLRLTAAGIVRLDGSAIDLKGQAQLSDALTAHAGRDLVRYTKQDGRVTVPVSISGSAESPKVRVDVGDLLKRAIRNRATEEVDKALKKGLGDLFKRR